MSNRRKIRHPRGHIPLADAFLAAQKQAPELGCNCQPEYSIWHDKDGVTHITLAHDEWCNIFPPKEEP